MNLDRLSQKINKKWPLSAIKLDWDGRSIIAAGNSPSAQERYEIGAYIVKHCKKIRGYKGLVNDVRVGGNEEPPMRLPANCDSFLEGRAFDAVIVGGGVIGCAVARYLSAYKLSIALIEKEADCAMQASGKNDGVIHPGFADKVCSKKGKLNTRGNRMYHSLSQELGFAAKWPGSLLLFKSPFFKLLIPYMRHRAKKNGVDGDTGFLNKKTVQKMEPELQVKHHGGFWMPSTGIASPFKVTLAFAENAAQNGVQFFFETALSSMTVDSSGLITHLHTNRGSIKTKLVINAAGVWADKVADFAGDRFFSIHPRQGTDMILDKKRGKFQRTIIGMPSLRSYSKNHSKGGGLIPCIEGNILVGPTAREIYERENYSTDAVDLKQLKAQLEMNIRLSMNDVITYYSGVRAANWEEDFIVEASDKIKNLVHAAAIQSPGFASAPAIAEDITALCIKQLRQLDSRPIQKNTQFNPKRIPPPELNELSDDEKNALIAKNPLYGKIVCRCEQISEGEIRDAIRSCLKIGIQEASLDSLKRRCRVGAGRCHAGFCTQRVMEIIKDETGLSFEKITKKGGESFVLGAAI